MGDIFLKLLNTSITASWLILAILCVRFLFYKMPKWVNCVLWGVVAIRLICPFSIESAFSLQPSAEPIKSSTVVEGEVFPYVPSVDSNIVIVGDVVNPFLAETFAYQEAESVAPLQLFTELAGGVWICGMIALFGLAIGSRIRLYFLVREAVAYKKDIFICDAVKSAFILGIMNPKIYLSSVLSKEEIDYVAAHEKAHLKRKDHLWKLFGYLLLCIYWFSPFCWIAYILLCKDIELACDEKVIRNMSFTEKKEYSKVLLSCATQGHWVLVCPLSFGEVEVKKRVKKVLNYKKPAFGISIAAIIICIILGICFLTNPEKEQQILGDEVTDEQNENSAVADLAHYLELSVVDEKFQDMSEEREAKILAEYGDLLGGYTLMSRETVDGETAYIVGHYEGDVTQSPFYKMYTMEYSGSGMTEMVQVLYLEENYDNLNEILFTEGISAVSTEGYIVQESKLFWSKDKDYILIQPIETMQFLYDTFSFYHIPGRGREYIEDALARGIALNTVTEPYLSVYMISEKYGEITENIPLTEVEASAVLSESKQEVAEGCGFAAALNINGDSILFTENTGVPQSVLDLVVAKCGYKFACPASITSSIKDASLVCSWLEEPIQLEASYIARLEEILKSAKMNGVGNCGYGVKLILTLENGEVLTVFKGMDDCGSLVFGSHGGYSISDEEDDEFWAMFGLGTSAEERLDMR